MFEIRNSPALRTIYLRMTGRMEEDELRAGLVKNNALADSYGGQPHLMLADMRGWVPLKPEHVHYIMDAMAYSRAKGLATCVHLADSEIAKLQTARLAREASPDGQTINVASSDEAEKVLTELRIKLAKAR